MNMTRIYLIISYFNALIWLLIGTFTIGGIIVDRGSLIVNLLVGIIFLLLAVLFFLKAHFFKKGVRNEETRNSNTASFSKYLMIDLILITTTVLLSLIILYGVLYRIFQEGHAVFG